MPGSESNVQYLGVFRFCVDERRRLLLPVKWQPRPELDWGAGREERRDWLLVTLRRDEGRGNAACLSVNPPERSKRLSAAARSACETERRGLGRSTTCVTVDAHGRFRLPEALAAEANLSNQVLLVGRIDHFEIWDPATYDQAFREDGTTICGTLGHPL